MENRKSNEKNQLSFSESWKQPVMEVALGASVIGAGVYLGTKGSPDMLFNSLKKARDKAGKSLDNYMNKKLSAVPRFFKNILLKTTPKVYDAVKNRPKAKYKAEGLLDYLEQQRGKMNWRDINDEAVKRHNEATAKYNFDVASGRRNAQPVPHPDFFKEQVRQEKLVSSLEQNTLFTGNNKNNQYQKKNKSLFNPADILTGTMIGAGISAWHGVDKLIHPPHESKKNKEKAFEVAGSYLKGFQPKDKNFSKNRNNHRQSNRSQNNFRRQRSFNDKNGGDFMRKQAGAVTSTIYDGVSGLVKRIPQSVAWGAGMTGVTLGAASLMKNNPELLRRPSLIGEDGAIDLGGKDKSSQTNVIIVDPMSLHSMSKMSESSQFGLIKKASILQRIKDFGTNVAGRYGDVRKLDHRINEIDTHYKNEVLSNFTESDIRKRIIDERGQQAFRDYPVELRRDFIEAQANQLKRKDQLAKEEILDEVKRDRLIALGGVGVAGGGLGLAFMGRKHEGNPS